MDIQPTKAMKVVNRKVLVYLKEEIRKRFPTGRITQQHVESVVFHFVSTPLGRFAMPVTVGEAAAAYEDLCKLQPELTVKNYEDFTEGPKPSKEENSIQEMRTVILHQRKQFCRDLWTELNAKK